MLSYPQIVDNFVNKRKRYEMMTKIKPHGPLPSQAQLAYLEDELAAFIHFGPNTFYDQEWGTGQEDPGRFNPTRLDAREWVRVLKETGFKKLILVVKHHDGFVLYPTAHTDYSVKASPWRNGEGDLLLEVSQAATEFDMDMGVYLSPWDAHSPLYHVDREADYNAYYLAQLKEILSNPAYGNAGKFTEVWMDGARGEGAQQVNYEFETWFETIRDLQGDCLIFSTEGTSIRWIGNERGYAGDPLWQKVKPDQLGTEAALDYLQHGDPSGTLFSIGEADVSLRPGWFYHEDQDPKSLEELVEIYFHSVGRGTPLLLNIPPNQDGLFDERDIQRLYEFRAYRDELSGRDSVGQRKGFDMLYSPERRAAYLARGERQLDSTNVPGKFRMLFERGWTMDSIENKSFTEKDSLEVAQHTYNFRAIAHNESRRTNADTYRRHIVHFPLIEETQYEAGLTPDKDFVYLYSRDLEVTPQMKKRMKVIVDSRISAIDQSTWMQRGVDTLTFVISGINDLVDATLIDRLNEKPEAAAE